MTATDSRNSNHTLAPVTESERVFPVDILRGFALLGILMMNITAFGLPSEAYVNPMLPALDQYVGKFEGLTRQVWFAIHLLFDMKMMTIFSMLFGAGLVLMGERSAGRDEGNSRKSFAGVYYRRLLWLFLIGMVHAYLIWYGDILVGYAMCGLLLYPVRRWRAGWLIGAGTMIMLLALPIWSGLGFSLSWVRDQATEAQAILDRGGTLSPEQKGMLDGWRETSAGMIPTVEQVAKEVDAHRGTWFESFKANAMEAVFMQTLLFVLMTVWRVLGAMLIGMGLMKLGVFAAARTVRFYAVIAAVGYGLGLPIVAYGGLQLIDHKFDRVYVMLLGWHYNYVGSFLIALAHTSAVMLIVKAGGLAWLTSRLAAVGRMALSNYLMQSILCTFIFWGWGLGYFAKLRLEQMVPIVVGFWVVQLLWSPWWLKKFRFGPAEWAWRSLTYLKPQTMRRGA